MPFVSVEKTTRGSFRADVFEVRMSAHLQSKKGTSRGIYISMSRAVVDQVGWKRLTDTPRAVRYVLVQEGVGDDAGFLMVMEGDQGNGYSLGISNKEGQAFSVSVSATKLKHYVLNEVPAPSAPVEFTVDEKDHTILIQCPEWLRYNSLSYTEPPKPIVEGKKSLPPTKAAETKELVKAAAKELPLNHKQRRTLVSLAMRELKP